MNIIHSSDDTHSLHNRPSGTSSHKYEYSADDGIKPGEKKIEVHQK